MARLEISEFDKGQFCNVETNANLFFELGLRYSTGRDVEQDYISAHKWFNLAVANGNKEAVDHRKELSLMMTQDEIRKAQREARSHLTLH